MRTTLTSVPFLLVLLALTVLYLLRWTILQEPLSAAIESAVLDATGVRVEVGAIRGNMLREIRVDALRTIRPNPGGTVYSLRVDNLVVRYRLADLLPFLSLANLPLPRFTSPTLDIGWLEAGELTPGLVVSNLSRTIPDSLALDLSGDAVVNTPEERTSARFDVSLGAGAAGAGTSGADRPARIELSEIASPWWPGDPGDTLSLVFGLAPGRLALRTDQERTSGGVRIDGALESSDADGPATLTGAELAASAGRFRARATADPQSAELVASLPADDRSNEFVNQAVARRDTDAESDADAGSDTDAPLLVAGALDLEAVLRLPPSDADADTDASPRQPPRAGRSVVEELFSAPALLVEDANVSASVDARSWRFASVAVERIASSADWSGGRLSVGASSATVGVEGLDLATASDPAAGFTLGLEGAAWNAATNEVSVDDLVVHGGGGRLRVDGLVTLPLAGSGLESVSGDLAGQLSIEQPDELAALLARLGVAPALPAGYSIGTSLAVDFALSGSRADARLDGRLRAQGPTLPGLAFASIEADAAITSDSVTPSRLRVQTLEVLAIATASNPGTGFTVNLEGAGWDTATNELGVDDLVVRAAGGRLRVDGLVTLPPAGSGLESVRGDLAGRLSIEQPDELAALLARFGVAPRAPGTAVPGLAFESIEADAALTPDSVTVSRLRVRTAGALGMLDGSGSFAADGLQLELDASEIPLGFLVGLLDPDLSAAATGTVSLRMSAEGDPESPTGTLIARGDSLAIDGEPVTIALDVRQAANEIRLAALTVDLTDLAEIRGSGSAPVSFGIGGLTTGDFGRAEMELEASLPGVIPYLLPDAAERWPEATLELTAALDGRSGSIRASATGFERAEEPTIVGIEPMTEFQLTASIADVLDASSTLTADLTSGGTSLASVDADPGSGITGEARLPLAELSHFVPGVDLPGGLLHASFRTNADAGGAQGEVTLESALVKFSPEVPTVSSLSGSLVYADEVLRIDALTGDMGGAPISVSGSWSFVDDDESPVEIRLGARNALLVRSPDMQLRADLDVALVGDSRSMRLSGDVGVTEARYTRPVQLFSFGTTAASASPDLQLFGVDAGWARSMLFDVAVTADRTIVISNNLFDGSLSADLTIGGNLSVPRPAGRVFTDAGTFRLPTARLSVEELEVRFPADAAFAPQVHLAATTSIQGYEMSVTVDGGLPSVEVRIVSAPPLPTDEALLLLTTGSRSSDLSFAPDVTGSLTAVGTVLGRQILNQLSRQMSEEEQEFFERIDFEVERERETGQIGEVGVEYQLGDDENWVLRFDRRQEESYTLQLGWRLWIE